MKDGYADDLSDFIRNGKLDSYELTDEELAQFLEVWRWTVWTRRTHPNGPDYDVTDAVQRLQAHMAQQHHVEVEYNTRLLLRQELEPLMYLRVLWDLPAALLYFLHPLNWLALFRSWRRARRYGKIEPVRDWKTHRRGYPRAALDALHEHAPDLLRRVYWRSLSPESAKEKRRSSFWWE